MRSYRPIHRKAVSSGSVELLSRLHQSGQNSPLSGEYAGHVMGVDGHFFPVAKEDHPGLFKIFLRATQLDILWNGFLRLRGGKSQIEKPKQAVYRGLPTASVMLIAAHFLPVTAAAVLLWLNLGGYYVGGEMQGGGKPEDNEFKLSTLQFVAKFHELLMQASLSVIVVGLIRHELLEGRAIPFGAIFGSLQFSNASYIFSKEFAGVWKATMNSRFRKIKLIILLLIGSILAITVGPSSAITMRPRLDTWPAGGTDLFLVTTHLAMWPDRMTAAEIPSPCRTVEMNNSTCLSQDWMDIGSQLISFFPSIGPSGDTTPQVYRLSDVQSVREVGTRTTAQTPYFFDQAVNTTPMSAFANALSKNGQFWAEAAVNVEGCTRRIRRFRWRKEVAYSIPGVKQPSTAVVCYSYNQDFLSRPEVIERLEDGQMLFPTGKSLCESIKYRQNGGQHEANWQQIQPEHSQLIDDFVSGSARTPEMQFVRLPRESFGRVSVGALASIPPSWPGQTQRLYSCAIRARWLDMDVKSTRYNLKVVSGDTSNGWPYNEVNVCNASEPVIELTPEWASYLNPTVQTTGKSVYHSLIEFAGTPPSASYWGLGPLYFGSVTESILSAIVTSGLSHSQDSAKSQGDLKFDTASICQPWAAEMMPNDKKEFGYGGNIYNMSTFDVTSTTKFTMKVDIEGYAYHSRGPSMILSCMVLFTYCTMVVIYIVFIFWKRSSSTSWDSVSEVVALAMQSQPSDKLDNTSAGINSTGIFSNNVRIIKTGVRKDRLELDFCDGTSLASTREEILEEEFFA